MTERMNHPLPEAMLFDLDGTLFRTEALLLPAYHAAFDQLRQEGSYAGETPPESRILGSLGMLLEHIWERVLPDAGLGVRHRADDLLLAHQRRLLAEGLGELYPGVRSTLERLHGQGVRLFVASNGLEPYVKEVVRWMGLAPLFEGLYSAGEYGTRSKVDLVRLALERHGVRSAWMVGDRSSDVEAGLANGLPVVGCRFAAFGEASELNRATWTIVRFEELLGLPAAERPA